MRNAQLAVQRHTNVYRSSRYQRATEIVGGEETRRVSWIDAWQVNTQALQDDKRSGNVDGDSYDANNPVNVSIRRPAKEEEPDRREG